jgi:hypothetical protein
VSDHIFADGDAFAIEHRWEVTKTAGWFGFGGRIYRDLRFDSRRLPMLAEQPDRGQEQASRGGVSEPWRPN